MKKIILSLLVLANLAFGGDFEDGIKAFKSGEYEKAFDFYKKSCDEGNAEACNNLGLMYKKGVGVAKDIKKAIKLFQKSCDNKLALSCFNLGDIYTYEHQARL